MISQIRPFEDAWRRMDSARRFNRVAYALFEAALGLIVGVIMCVAQQGTCRSARSAVQSDLPRTSAQALRRTDTRE
jgi:hypothetical protein